MRSMHHKLENGQCITKAPIGYLNCKDDKGQSTVKLDEERFMYIRRIFTEYSTGVYSLRELTKKVAEWGLVTRAGNKLSNSRVHALIQNRFYYGVMELWSITRDEHDKKAYELKQRQQQINKQLANFDCADEEFTKSLTLLLDLIQNAGLLFRSSNLEQKRKLINLVFQNLSLKAGKVDYTLVKLFELFIDEAKCSNWLDKLDGLRTRFKSEILLFSTQVNQFRIL
ncbi:MAG: hypothetical protein COV35_08080 [Alphaproteobacteria bacterium CG11_big_fil_rev_8_21_14_0_20_39_49]|nr:MAG: hypothetical protein COV35_08080 [Alphaproteobacteria bacterium CG11_big_fil_rev_8_21_14_0_20_39_49]